MTQKSSHGNRRFATNHYIIGTSHQFHITETTAKLILYIDLMEATDQIHGGLHYKYWNNLCDNKSGSMDVPTAIKQYSTWL